MRETVDAVERLRVVARQREALARAHTRKAERYRAQAREMRQVAARIARTQAPLATSGSRDDAT